MIKDTRLKWVTIKVHYYALLSGGLWHFTINSYQTKDIKLTLMYEETGLERTNSNPNTSLGLSEGIDNTKNIA